MLSLSCLWSLRKIVRGEVEQGNGFRFHAGEGLFQMLGEALAGMSLTGLFVRRKDCLANKQDQGGATKPREPMGALIEEVAANQDAWDDRGAGMNAEGCETGLHGSAVQNGGGSCADASFGEDAYDPALSEALQGAPQGISVGAAAIHGDAVEGREDPFSPSAPEHLFHGKPVETPGEEAADDRGVKVADMIGGHDESPTTWHGGQLDDSYFAGEGKEEAAGGDHQPVKGSTKSPFRQKAAGMPQVGFFECRGIRAHLRNR